MAKIARTYTIMVVPERNGSRSYSLRVSRPVIIAALVQLTVVVLAVALMLSKSADVVRKVNYYYKLRGDNEILIKENNQLRAVRQKVDRMDSLAAYLERLSLAPGAAEAAALRAAQKAAAKRAPDDTERTPGDRDARSVEKTSESGIRIAGSTGQASVDQGGVPTILPVDGWITQPFSDDSTSGEKTHLGIDIAAAEGGMIKAPASGVVIDVGVDKDYGNMFSIRHEAGFITRYGHCETIFVTKNEKIERGQAIALVGSTGHSTAPHLHYEVLKDGKNRNPFDFVKTVKK
jgi:murein DD-endopeptidase MepM/ murein hydrolase activator NlpD